MKTTKIGLLHNVVSVFLLSVAISNTSFPQSDPNSEILVYFTSGVERIAGGNSAIVTSVAIRSLFARLNVATSAVSTSFPNFSEADTIQTLTDGRQIKRMNMGRVFNIRVPNAALRARVIDSLLSMRSNVAFAEQNGTAAPSLIPNDTYYQSQQWSLKPSRMNAEQAWDIYTGNSNNYIAIVDGGIDGTHPDLSGKVSGDGGWGWGGHGIHVAGIAAAYTNNSTGIAGVDWNAQLHAQRVDNVGGDQGSYQAVVDAVNYSPNVFVLNNSWGLTPFGRYSTTVRAAFAYAYKMNRTAVVAMGNNNGSQTQYPAGFGQGIISVGATNSFDEWASFSNTGNHIDVSAPGDGIYSTYRSPDYFSLSGTSMAAPHVSGLASLMKGYYPNLSNDDIENIIRLSVDDISVSPATTGWDQYTGYGRVNAKKALDYLRPPYVIRQQLATGGGTDVGQSGYLGMAVFGASGLADGVYMVKRHSVHKWVYFPYTVNPQVWGRGVSSNGWSAENPNFGMGFSGLVAGNVTNTSALMYTYVYEVWDDVGQWVGWYPTTPQGVSITYTVLGTDAPPLSVEISGPECLTKGQGGTWTANTTGGSGSFSYQWYITYDGGGWWYSLGTGQSQYYTMDIRDCTLRCDVHDNILGNNASATHDVCYGMEKQNAAVQLPNKYELHNAYPNPFNPSTQIKFDLPENATVSFVIYDILGRKVAELVNGYREAGYHSTTWNAENVASGIYVARFITTDEWGRMKFSKISKLVLTK